MIRARKGAGLSGSLQTRITKMPVGGEPPFGRSGPSNSTPRIQSAPIDPANISLYLQS